MMNEYEKQALEFLAETGTKISLIYEGFKPYFDDDKVSRNVYKVRVRRGQKSMTFRFGDSLDNTQRGKIPTNYSLLASMSAESYCPETIDEFVSEYGYELHNWADVKRIEKCFRSCKRMAKNINRLFFEPEVMEKLREIC